MATTYAIPDGRTVMAATLWTGTNATLAIDNSVNGTSMQPDFMWIKRRSSVATSHVLIDSVRGITKVIWSDLTGSESTPTAGTGITAINSNGFTLGTDISTSGSTNTNAQTFVGWQWKAGGATGVSNTSGSITSTVSANTAAGFSVVTYTGTGANATVGHGLGVAPSMIILKSRVGATNWVVYHANLTSAAYVIQFNLTNAQSSSPTIFNSTAPTSSVFSIGTSSASNDTSMVAYCFAAVAGYSAFGSYTGNGSTDGPFVYLGFRPRFVMIKRTDAADDWIVMDSSRNTYNVANSTLFPNGNYSETTDANRQEDFLSNGFKIRSSPVYINASGGTYIYAAFAENPFKYANAR